MKRIIVDLSVATVASYPRLGHEFDYKRTEEAALFLKNVSKAVEEGKLMVVTPKNFYALLGEWQYKEIVVKMLDFYNAATSVFVETADLVSELIEKEVDYNSIIGSLVKGGVKEEDALIIVTASLNSAVIVTYNRKDLRGKIPQINAVLAEYGIPEVEINEPSELEGLEGGVVNA